MTDPILLWNAVALEANRVSHTNGQGEQAGPPLSARALAIVHLAMYDAYAGVINDPNELPRYIADPPSPAAGASPLPRWSMGAARPPSFKKSWKRTNNPPDSPAWSMGCSAAFHAEFACCASTWPIAASSPSGVTGLVR